MQCIMDRNSRRSYFSTSTAEEACVAAKRAPKENSSIQELFEIWKSRGDVTDEELTRVGLATGLAKGSAQEAPSEDGSHRDERSYHHRNADASASELGGGVDDEADWQFAKFFRRHHAPDERKTVDNTVLDLVSLYPNNAQHVITFVPSLLKAQQPIFDYIEGYPDLTDHGFFLVICKVYFDTYHRIGHTSSELTRVD